MDSLFHRFLLSFVATVALGRVAGIVALKLRQARYAKRAVAYPRSWRDLCTVPEPYLLAGATLTLALQHRTPDALPAAELARAAAGGVLALLAVVLMLWALRAFPALSTGHYVLPEQQIVCSGPYRLVRHPLYLAAFAIWVALAISFASRFALAASLLYVVPAYLFYIRSEEQMLLGHFGDAYRTYQRRVGMLFPRWPRRASPSEGFPRCAG